MSNINRTADLSLQRGGRVVRAPTESSRRDLLKANIFVVRAPLVVDKIGYYIVYSSIVKSSQGCVV